MILSLPRAELIGYLAKQLDNDFPDGTRFNLAPVVDMALERLEYCFSWIRLSRYRVNGNPKFDHLHGDQSATFLYFAANCAWRNFEDQALAQKLFLLNKSRNGLVCMYDTILPEVFAFIHTVGIVLGKGTYDNRFAVFQNVTIGPDRGLHPHIGSDTVIYGGANVVGGVHLGRGSVVVGNSAVIHRAIPPDTIVYGLGPNIQCVKRKRDIVGQYFLRESERGG